MTVAIPLIALVIALAGLTMLRPLRDSFVALAVLTVFVVGLLDYYFGLRNAYWLAYAGAVVLLVRWLIGSGVNAVGPVPAHLWVIATFLAVLTISTLAHFPAPTILAVGLKIYLPFWLLVPVLIALFTTRDYLAASIRAFVLLPFVQLPFVVHQHFWIAARRGRAGWDAVVGTFGGDPLGGGAAGTLLVTTIIAMLAAIHQLQAGSGNRVLAAASLAASLTCLALSEVAAVFVLLPLALIVQQLPRARRRPFSTLLALAALALPLAAIEQFYAERYWSSYGATTGSTLRSNVYDPQNFDLETGEVGRGAALPLWGSDPEADWLSRAIGYGAASTRVQSSVATGAVGRRYAPLDVASTALAQLLWDSGVLGAALFVLAIVLAGLRALRLAFAETGLDRAGQFGILAAICAVDLASLLYNRSLVDRPVEQLLLVMVFALLAVERPQSAWYVAATAGASRA